VSLWLDSDRDQTIKTVAWHTLFMSKYESCDCSYKMACHLNLSTFFLFTQLMFNFSGHHISHNLKDLPPLHFFLL
jgi:hypothetical protein